MKKYIWILACMVALAPVHADAAKKQTAKPTKQLKAKKAKQEVWPDGT